MEKEDGNKEVKKRRGREEGGREMWGRRITRRERTEGAGVG